MKKRLCTLFLVSTLIVSGCGYKKEFRELQENYNSLSTKHEELEGRYEELKNAYDNLNEKYAQIQDLPDVSVTLIDGQDDVIDLELHSSVQQAQKEKKEYYVRSGYLIYGSTITVVCNNKEKVEDVYLIEAGKIKSLMQSVEDVGNTYVFQFEHGAYRIYSIVIKINGKEFYTSVYPKGNR